MLELTLGPFDFYDEIREEFVSIEKKTYVFSFNLLALDRWESKYRKRFLDNNDLTVDDYLNFFEEMCLSDGFDKRMIDNRSFKIIKDYMEDIPTATIIPERKRRAGERKTIFTSEIIYGYMALSSIPFEWEKKNLNKLILLINTISSLQTPPEKMSKRESMEEHRRIIMERRRMSNKVKT